jgi:hypothetical protein
MDMLKKAMEEGMDMLKKVMVTVTAMGMKNRVQKRKHRRRR